MIEEPRGPTPAELARTLAPALAEQGAIRLVVLFGSRARGTGRDAPRREASDFDIAVLSREDCSRSTRDKLAAVIPVLARAMPSDLLDVVFVADAPPLLRYEVAAHGVVLFEREEGTWVRFRFEAFRDYCDTEHMRRIHRDARIRRLKEVVRDGGPGDLLEEARRVGRLLEQAEGPARRGS